ncbi:hypothetical protein NE237_003997 [Protea cynaroides]|uniref:Glucan endo-1,3-beta-D-glucosidase n=1 Tax=Protea cynaroides TaxID=273540 RepID=A0A9Q0KHV3_9MAGN|nr:hypothetical protein NE237_003997 [Protea cynaroides]
MDALWLPTLSLLVGSLLMVCLNRTGAQVGVCYGMKGNNLPSPKAVVDLYKSQNITRMRLYNPNQAMLEALKDSNIEVMMDVPISALQKLARDNITAIYWINDNVMNYWPSVKFRYIAVGNEVSPNSSNAQFVLPAMQYIYKNIMISGLQDQIKVSTVISTQLLGTSYPPSEGAFRDDVRSFIDPIVLFLVQKESPLLANVYPYFSYSADQGIGDTNLAYALFTSQSVVVQDGNLEYQNLFDSMVDTLYSALGMVVEIVVSETGWPSAGGIGATTENAKIYNSNLIQHVNGGTPKRPGKTIETYVFSMFDENQKNNTESEQHWGLFLPNKQSKYPISFGSVPINSPPSQSNNMYCFDNYITIHLPTLL